MDLHRADMGLLIALDALLSARSVTRAAKTMGLSQPALSAQLAKLRRLFDDPLLVGNAHGMTPTLRAVKLQEPLHLLLNDLQALVANQSVFDPATAERTFAIAATDYAHATLTSPLVVQLRVIAPGIRIAALPFSPENVHKQLEGGTADLCITSESLTPADIPAQKLLHERFALILSVSHPNARKRITLDLFCAMDHVLASPSGGGFSGVVDTVLDSMGRNRNVVGSLNSFLLVPDLVKSSRCVAVVPERLALAHKDELKIAKVPIEIPGFDLFQSWHPRSKNDKGHIWLRGVIHAQVRSNIKVLKTPVE